MENDQLCIRKGTYFLIYLVKVAMIYQVLNILKYFNIS